MPTPAPGDGEVLIKAAATTVNSGDARLRALNVPRGMRVPARLRLGLTKLRQPILGFEMAGRVQAVGAAVSGFRRVNASSAHAGSRWAVMPSSRSCRAGGS